MRIDFYNNKILEVNCNIEALQKSISTSRYVDLMDKEGNVSENAFDQQSALEELIRFKGLLMEKIGAMQDGTKMI